MTKLSVSLSISVVLMMALMMPGIALAEEEDEEVYFITMPDGGVAEDDDYFTFNYELSDENCLIDLYSWDYNHWCTDCYR